VTDFNDLIGLKRAWGVFPGDGSGFVDCCALAAEIHYRLGYWDYRHELGELFKQFNDDTLPPNFIARWLLKNACRLNGPELHAVVMLPCERSGALGTIVGDNDVVYIAPSGCVVRSPLPEGFGWHFRMKR
jgi:hypothetical protein